VSPWRTVTTRYEEVSRTVKRRVTCAICGKKFNRQRTFTNTVNPFNKNAAGVPKSWSEVEENVVHLAEQWQPEQDCGNHHDHEDAS
jgi:hypothetical protein